MRVVGFVFLVGVVGGALFLSCSRLGKLASRQKTPAGDAADAGRDDEEAGL